MIERVVSALIEIENKFGTSEKQRRNLAKEFGNFLDKKYCVMSTPVLTNAGRYLNKPLSACTVPSLDLIHDSKEKITSVILKTHQDGMGTGFCLNDLENPVSTLRDLNRIAISGTFSGKEDRPVGNMAILSVYHPKILEFINSKVDADKLKELWKFNISVDCDQNFFDALEKDLDIVLKNGSRERAVKIFDSISKAASICADPGLVFLERMERDNPTPKVARYSSTAPCGEVGLAKGESCQFGYINLSKFLKKSGEIDLKNLRKVTHSLLRMLDNALEISVDNYSEESSKFIMSQKRKIGIGVCGLSDLFIKKKIYYDSQEARVLARDLVAFINFESKKASAELAKERGSFKAMDFSQGNKYLEKPFFIERKYGSLSTKFVSVKDWKKLSDDIQETKYLRNASTIALPPTGRSALTIDASTGIEPIFSKEEYLKIFPEQKDNNFIQTAKTISPENHLLMAAFIQQAVDESISKTINLPTKTTVEEIKNIYLLAWRLGLKGISVYRDGSKNWQPKQLS